MSEVGTIWCARHRCGHLCLDGCTKTCVFFTCLSVSFGLGAFQPSLSALLSSQALELTDRLTHVGRAWLAWESCLTRPEKPCFGRFAPDSCKAGDDSGAPAAWIGRKSPDSSQYRLNRVSCSPKWGITTTLQHKNLYGNVRPKWFNWPNNAPNRQMVPSAE